MPDLAAIDVERTHVLRPVPPWRGDVTPLSQCGKDLGQENPCWGIREFAALLKKHGQQRMALLTCMTCWETSRRHPVDWDIDPVAVIGRQVAWAGSWCGGIREDRPGAVRFRNELLAIAEMVSRHPEEFEAIISGLAEAPSLADHRRTRRASRRP